MEADYVDVATKALERRRENQLYVLWNYQEHLTELEKEIIPLRANVKFLQADLDEIELELSNRKDRSHDY